MIIPPENLEDIAKKFGFGKYAKEKKIVVPATEIPQPAIRMQSGVYYFSNVPYNDGYFEEVGLIEGWLLGGKALEVEQWIELSLTGKAILKVPNSKLLYQLMRILYDLRDKKEEDEVIKTCTQELSSNFKELTRTSTIVWNEQILNRKRIAHLEYDGTISNQLIEMPDIKDAKPYNSWQDVVLADRQPETSLGTVNKIPEELKPTLEAILGKGYEEAGAVFQYLIPKIDVYLSEIIISLPIKTNNHSKWGVLFGTNHPISYIKHGAIKLMDKIPKPAKGVIIDPTKFKKIAMGNYDNTS